MPEAFNAYDALFRDLGARHYLPTGIIFVRRQRDDWYAIEGRKLDAYGVAHRRLSGAEIASRLPMLQARGVEEVIEFGGAGMLFARQILDDLAAWLAQSGAVLHAGRCVDAVDLDLGQVIVGGRRHSADLVLVAAGAWAERIVPQLRSVVRPARQTVLFLDPPADLRAAWSQAPMLVWDGGAHPGYALPPRDGARLKIGGHHFSRYGDPDEDRSATPQDLAPVQAVAEEAFVDFRRYRFIEARANYIAATAEERFRVGPFGRAGWIVSACSGHGFKLAPLIAEGVAAAVAGERDAAEVSEWAAGR